ncbi:MAG: hypothetical protein ACK4VO_13550, partial [Pseudobdellovibrio sp.]
MLVQVQSRAPFVKRDENTRLKKLDSNSGSSLFMVGNAKNIKKHKHLEISSDSFFHSYNQKLCFLQD